MSFWNSKNIKAAKKEHTCQYCGRTIKKGESYTRETGTYEGSFSDYCICGRCNWFLQMQYDLEDGIGTFEADLFDYDLITCYECGSSSLRKSVIADDTMSMECECRICGENWVADLTIEGLGHAMQNRERDI